MNNPPVKIYHNPHCSKSRQSLALLEESNANADVVHYLDNPPTAAELRSILSMLGLSPRDLMRKGESAYSDNNLGDDRVSESALIEAMVANPILIERPIVVANGKAVIGRPPERVLDVINRD